MSGERGNSHRVILFDHPSLVHLLVSIPAIRRARTVYFLGQGAVSPFELRGIRRRLCLGLVRLIHPGVEAKDVPPEASYPHLWKLNKESLSEIDALEAKVRSSSAYRLALDWLEDPNTIRYYKMALATRMPRERLLFRVAKELSAQHPEGRCFKATQGAWRVLRRLLNLALLAVLPVGFVLARLKRLQFRRIEPPECRVKMSVLQGFGNPVDGQDRTRRRADDGGLYGERFRPGQIVHVFDYWRFTPELKSHFKQEMDKRGLAWMDSDSYRIDLNFLRRAAWYQWTIFKHLLTDPSLWVEENGLLEITLQLAHACLRQELELANVRYSVSFIRNDYSPSHVVATLFAHRVGARTVGTQHHGSPYDIPQLAYVHLDHYAVFGHQSVRLFDPYWSRLPLEKTGRENVDWVVELTRDPKRRESIRKRLEAKYGPHRARILFILPSGFEWCSRRQWDEMYNGLWRLPEVDLDCTVILRFRSEQDPSRYPHLTRFLDLPGRDPRIALEHRDFTTHELLAVSDAVIANTASLAIQEAAAIRVKVFSFDFMGTARLYYPDYGSDFILESSEDLLKTLARLGEEDPLFDCQWDRLSREGNYHADGKNHQRLQEVVWKALSAARQGGSLPDRCQTESTARELSAVAG